MKIDQHNQLAELQRDVAELAAKLQSELEAHRKRMSELSSEEARKQYAPQFLAQKISEERGRARKVEADHRAALAEVKKRLESEAVRWSTEHALRTAKFVDGDSVEHQILGELRHARLAQEFRHARPDELVGYIKDAADRASLAEIEMLRREVGRRKFPSEVERIPLLTALNGAIEAVEIPGQEQALAILESVSERYSIADDHAAELRTGQVATGTRMRAAMQKYFGTGESGQESAA